MRWLRFILSHSIFIAICAVALCFQTALLLHIPLTFTFYAFVFFSTVSSYNFYWLLSGYSLSDRSLYLHLKRQLSNLLVFTVSSAGLIISIYHLPHLLPEIGVAVMLTLLYALPLLPFRLSVLARKAGVAKTMLLAFSWAFITVYLPYQYAPDGNRYIMLLLLINRFLFMLMLCIIFDARDTSVDKIRGLQSLTTLLSAKTVQQIMLLIFTAYLINGIVLRMYYQEIAQIAALLVSGGFTAVVYILSLKKRSYFFYYFIVDGLMLFSALAAYVASI
jgi:hypothetical protein